MNKTVDINERTLEKEKKNFIEFCKAAEGVLSVFLAIMIIGAIALVIVMIMDNVMKNAPVPSDSEYTTAEGIFNGVVGLGMLIGYSIAVNFGVKVFKKLKDGETPFRYEIADKIKAAGMTLFVTGFFAIAAGIMEGFFAFEDTSVRIDLDIFIWGALIIAIAYIFNYGCKLQQESDETI